MMEVKKFVIITYFEKLLREIDLSGGITILEKKASSIISLIINEALRVS